MKVNAAMLKHFPLEFHLDDPEMMAHLADGFDQISTSEGAITNVVGCIDGLAIRIPCPSPSECPDPLHYFNRKQFFSVNCQAICDADLKFRWTSMNCAGSTNDVQAFEDTDLYRAIQAGFLRRPYSIFGDAAYICNESVITPFASSIARAGTAFDVFNFYQSNIRIRIECAFGVLVARYACACINKCMDLRRAWPCRRGLLWRPLSCKLKNVADRVLMCMSFHNICRDKKVQDQGRSRRKGWMDFGSPSVHLTEQFDECRWVDTMVPPDATTPGRRRDLERSDTRADMAHKCWAANLKRPVHSRYVAGN